jgi:DNA polymerase zeta
MRPSLDFQIQDFKLSQAKNNFLVSGIEIIRRDGCQIAAKLLEKCIKLLFEYRDVDKLKFYLRKQLVKLTTSKINLNEFVIAKEYRGKETYANMKSVAACQIISRTLAKDPLSEPLVGERVPYLIVYGPPGLPLYELVRSPEEFLANDLKLNYEYYVLKQILPPLDRILSLMNINVFTWAANISFKPKIFHKLSHQTAEQSRCKSLAQYFYTNDCVLCGKKCDQDDKLKNLCNKCSQLDQYQVVKLKIKFKRCEQTYDKLMSTCKTCTFNPNYKYNEGKMQFDCCSFDCPNMYMSYMAKTDIDKFDYLRNVIDDLF